MYSFLTDLSSNENFGIPIGRVAIVMCSPEVGMSLCVKLISTPSEHITLVALSIGIPELPLLERSVKKEYLHFIYTRPISIDTTINIREMTHNTFLRNHDAVELSYVTSC